MGKEDCKGKGVQGLSKKALSLLLSVLMLFGAFPISAAAAPTEELLVASAPDDMRPQFEANLTTPETTPTSLTVEVPLEVQNKDALKAEARNNGTYAAVGTWAEFLTAYNNASITYIELTTNIASTKTGTATAIGSGTNSTGNDGVTMPRTRSLIIDGSSNQYEMNMGTRSSLNLAQPDATTLNPHNADGTLNQEILDANPTVFPSLTVTNLKVKGRSTTWSTNNSSTAGQSWIQYAGDYNRGGQWRINLDNITMTEPGVATTEGNHFCHAVSAQGSLITMSGDNRFISAREGFLPGSIAMTNGSSFHYTRSGTNGYSAFYFNVNQDTSHDIPDTGYNRYFRVGDGASLLFDFTDTRTTTQSTWSCVHGPWAELRTGDKVNWQQVQYQMLVNPNARGTNWNTALSHPVSGRGMIGTYNRVAIFGRENHIQVAKGSEAIVAGGEETSAGIYAEFNANSTYEFETLGAPAFDLRAGGTYGQQVIFNSPGTIWMQVNTTAGAPSNTALFNVVGTNSYVSMNNSQMSIWKGTNSSANAADGTATFGKLEIRAGANGATSTNPTVAGWFNSTGNVRELKTIKTPPGAIKINYVLPDGTIHHSYEKNFSTDENAYIGQSIDLRKSTYVGAYNAATGLGIPENYMFALGASQVPANANQNGGDASDQDDGDQWGQARYALLPVNGETNTYNIYLYGKPQEVKYRYYSPVSNKVIASESKAADPVYANLGNIIDWTKAPYISNNLPSGYEYITPALATQYKLNVMQPSTTTVGTTNPLITIFVMNADDKALLEEKNKFKSDLEAYAEKIKGDIDLLENASQKDKDDAKAAIDAELVIGLANIDNAGTIADAKTAQETSKAVMDEIYNNLKNKVDELATAKTNAIADLNAYAAAAIKEIDEQMPSVSEAEKTRLKSEVETARKNGETAINAADTVEAVATVLQTGKDNIDKVSQEAANIELTEYAKKVKEDIANVPGATAQAIAGAQAKIDPILTTAKGNVNAATDLPGIHTAMENGKNLMKAELDKLADNTDPLAIEKKEAKDALKEYGEAAKQAIQDLPTLDQTAKDALKAEVDAKVKAGEDAIDKATTTDGITAAETAAKGEVDKISKQAAIDELNAFAAEQNDRIENTPGANADQKATAKAKVAEELATALDNVDKAADLPAITKAVEDGEEAMKVAVDTWQDTVDPLANEKKEAKDALKEYGEAAKQAIQDLPTLDQTAKDALKAEVDAKVKAGEDAIDKATTTDGITAAETAAKGEVDKISKQAAIDELNAFAKDKKAELEATEGVTDDEINAAKAEVDIALGVAVGAVNAANDLPAITNAVEVGEAAMDAVNLDSIDMGPIRDQAKSDLEKKADDAKKAIDALENLSDDEKVAEKGKIDTELATGLDNIDNAKTPSEVDKAKNDAMDNMDKIVEDATLQDAKNAAIKDLEAKAEDLIAKINDPNNADLANVPQADKTAAIDEIKDILADAIEAVDEAETVNAINNARDEGKGNMQEEYDKLRGINDENLEKAKAEAKADLDEHARLAKLEVDAMENLTRTEKNAFKNEIEKERVNGNKAIDGANTAEDINTALTNAKMAINEDVADAALQDARNKGEKDLQDYAKVVKARIDAVEGASAADKTAAKAEVDKILEDYAEQVQNAISERIVNSTVNQGKAEMDKVLTGLQSKVEDDLQTEKDNAKALLNEYAAEAIKIVNALPHLSEAEKADFVKDIIKERDLGNTAIDAATDVAGVKNALANGKAAIDDVVADAKLQDKKNLVEAGLEKYAEQTKEKIDALTDVKASDKQAAKAEVDKILRDAIEAIDDATTEKALDRIDTNAKKDMDNIYGNLKAIRDDKLDQAKEEAKESLRDKADEAKRKIDAMPELTDAEKQAFKDKVDDELEKGLDAIDAAATIAEVTDARKDAEKAIDGVVVDAQLQNDKNAAIEELKKYADEINKNIDKLTNASDADKAKAKEDIAKALDEGIKAIEAAPDNATINTEKAESKKEMDDIYNNIAKIDLDDAKKAASDALKDLADEIKKEINDQPNLSDAEKKEYTDAVDQDLADGLKAIEDAKTVPAVTEAKKDAEIEMLGELEDAKLQDAKNAAIKALEDHAKDVKAKIDALPSDQISDEEKAAAKAEIDQILKDAIAEVKAAETIPAVNDAKTDGIADMDEVYNNLRGLSDQRLEDYKDSAKEALKDKAEEAKKDIDALPNLSDKEKQDAKDLIDQELEDGLKAIDDATSIYEVSEARKDAENAMDEIVEDSKLQDAKNAAIKELQDHANELNGKIDALPNVSDQAKADAKAAIAKELADAIAGVNAAQDIPTVKLEKNDGITAMDKIYNNLRAEDLDTLKDEAKDELKDKAADAVEEIDNMPNLTDDEKKEFKDQVQEELDKGIEAIDNAETPDEVTDALGNGKNEIDAVVDGADLQDAKNAAIKELEKHAEDTKAKIDALTEVSDAEKKAAKDEIDQILKDAIADVNKSTTPDEINAAVTEGKVDMDEVYHRIKAKNDNRLDEAKEDAKNDLQDKADEAKKDIDDMETLTPKEKEDAKKAVDEELNKGLEAIDNAPSSDAANQAKDAAEDKIEDVVRDAAIKELENYADDKKKEIDALDIPDDEKTAAKKEIDDILKDAIQAVKDADDLEGIRDAVDTGKKKMDEVVADLTIEINYNDHFAYIAGYPNGTVQPNGNLTRAETAVIFYKLIIADDKDVDYPSKFSDVTNKDGWYYKAVTYLTKYNVLSGYPDGTFKPGDKITRAEFASIVNKIAQLKVQLAEDDKVVGTNPFTDIATATTKHWAYDAIMNCYTAEIISGYNEDGVRSFKPNREITRAEAVSIVNGMLNRRIHKEDIPTGIKTFSDLQTTHWGYAHMVEATNSHDFDRKTDGYETWTKIRNDAA